MNTIRTTHWLCALAGSLIILLGLGTTPTLAQSSATTLKKKLKKTYSIGAKAGNEGNYDTAAKQFEQALTYAEKLELRDIRAKIRTNLVSSLKNAASTALKKKRHKDALMHYQQVLNYDTTDAGVYHNRGIALLALDSTQAGLQSLQKAVAVGKKTGNTKVAGLATERIRDEFMARASKALRDGMPQATLDALDEMKTYVSSNAKSLFYRASALYEQKKYKQAIATARKGLEMHQGSRSDAAKYHFVVAESQMELGNKSAACNTFKKSAFGDYKSRSEHYLKNECDE